jgi:carbonic anhydrase
MFRKRVFASLVFAAVVSMSLAFAGAQPGDDAFSKLMDGNKKFVSGSVTQPDLSDARRKELTGGQRPVAIVVTCSDSRVAPEHIFNQGLGDIFVIRVAGNVLDPVALGSIEYAAEHLHTPLLVLMGHEKCGAVTAAVEAKGKPEGNIGAIVAKILPAVRKAKLQGGGEDEIVAKAIKMNVFQSYEDMLKNSPVLKHMIAKGELKVVESLYHLGTGEVEILKTEAMVPAAAEHKEHEGKERKAAVGC